MPWTVTIDGKQLVVWRFARSVGAILLTQLSDLHVISVEDPQFSRFAEIYPKGGHVIVALGKKDAVGFGYGTPQRELLWLAERLSYHLATSR